MTTGSLNSLYCKLVHVCLRRLVLGLMLNNIRARELSWLYLGTARSWALAWVGPKSVTTLARAKSITKKKSKRKCKSPLPQNLSWKSKANPMSATADSTSGNNNVRPNFQATFPHHLGCPVIATTLLTLRTQPIPQGNKVGWIYYFSNKLTKLH